ncbi:hypothetical protein ABEQ78_17565 [Bacillus altitudinis]|uniref:Bacteriophage SP-beta YorD domain-containing protein n=1 Tax=Bacillus altitudinis TaxID=293387 RepID=A0A653V777_BACAB|nr:MULTISPECIES: hypothetical protein [Bacillus]AMM98418.1 hypothetical protein UP12_14155 [Bacillus pumilus]MDM5164126.1 hypothetical protein [Bacillus altitudinis]MED0850923.1 hypothetical protein [Bacillus altitudinis]VXC01762.1 conserved hypothetical protein [Bacillus altitudinis]
MKPIYAYDENFKYIPGGDKEIPDDAEIPEGFTDVQPQEGLYIAEYNPTSKTWSESATQEYIDSLQIEQPPDDIDLLKQQNAVLTKQLTELTKEAAAAKLCEAQMAKQLAQLMTEIQEMKGGEKS